MRKVLSLFLAIVFFTCSMVTQGQQLKTFHSFCPGGKEYPNDLSYTGYEDEMGNITKHGLWTANLTKGKYSINFKQGKLDGNGTIISSTTTCNLKYVDDKLISINYVEKKNGGNIIKYTLNKDGLLVGDFEFRNNSDEAIPIYDEKFNVKERHYFKHIKGKFDDSGKATGWWEIELTGSYKNEGVVKNYYEQGYCLGADEKTIELSRAYLIDKKMSEIELRNRGYYVINDLPNIKNDLPNIKRELEVAIFTAENYMYFMYDFPESQCMSLKFKNVFNFDNIFNHIYLLGSTITYMSAELFQKLKTAPSQLKFDENLKKYYTVKTDGKSRLYVPLENETEFHSLLLQKQELEKRKQQEKQDSLLRIKKEEASQEAIKKVKLILDYMMDAESYLDSRWPYAREFRPILNYKIDSTYFPDSPQECVVDITINTGKANSPYVSYKTSVVVNFDYPKWRIDNERSFVKKEKVNNAWDYIESVKDSSKLLDKQLQSYKKEYPQIVATYKNEGISYKNQNNDVDVQYKYYTTVFSKQQEYLKFVDLVKQIDDRSNKIIQASEEYKDIAKSYQAVSKTWNLTVNGLIFDEVKRLMTANYSLIQDSCLTFIELRKTITQNNAKIANYSKTAPTIVKAYNAYMKGVDLSWNQESERNQAIREIIKTQNALMTVLSKPNIGELDTTVKKSKAKTWEEVKKIVMQ